MTVRVRLDMAIWMAVFGTPWMVAAWLLWRAWWRRAGAELSVLDGPALLLAAAAATLPADRRDWGTAMTAELAQVQDPTARWRFAAGCARAAVFPPGGNRAAVAGALTFAAPGGDRPGHRRRPARGTGVRAELRRAGGWAGDPGGGPFGPGRPGRTRSGGRRAGAGRRRRLCRVHHLVRGRVPLDAPGLPAHHLGHPPAGDGGGPGGGPGQLPVAGAAPAALAAPRPARPAL